MTFISKPISFKKKTLLDEYFEERLQEERAPLKPCNEEYACNTCRFNVKIEELDRFERSSKKLTFIPKQFRKTLKDVGIVFTKNSYLYQAHLTSCKDHDWFQYQ